MIYWNNNQEESNVALDQLYSILAELIEVKDNETDECSISEGEPRRTIDPASA